MGPAHHLDSRLALSVNPMLQPKRPELLFGNLAALELPNPLFKNADLCLDSLRRMTILNFRG